MKTLPYFKWYPADAEADDFYASLSNEELGAYHRLLNRAWLNNGIPSDVETLSKLCRMKSKRFEAIWEKVGKRWIQSNSDANKLVNRRQEEERASAIEKSEHNQRFGNANATRTRSDKNANATRTERVSNANDTPRAYDSVCVSFPSEGGAGGNGKIHAADMRGLGGCRCAEFCDLYPDQSDRDSTAREYLSIISASEETDVFACLARYCASERVARGITMSGWKWLRQQKANKWGGNWQPKAREPTAAPSIYVKDEPPVRGVAK